MKITALRAEFRNQQIIAFCDGSSHPLVTQHANSDHRPFLHPIMAPDGIGELTEYSPGHHPHQTGLYWGFTRVNGTEIDPDTLKEWFYKPDKPAEVQRKVGRDFFHHPDGDYWQCVSADVLVAAGSEVKWQTVYHMLDAAGNAILIERQNWALRVQDEKIILDLEWIGQAQIDTTIGEFPYGGMFLRMPFRKENGGRALNSEGADQPNAEGQRARWGAVEMPIPGREEMPTPLCSIAIMDHPTNPDHPTPWRVDGQLGIGPSRGLLGDWKIPQSSSAVFRHRLVVACGGVDEEGIEREWQRFAKT